MKFQITPINIGVWMGQNYKKARDYAEKYGQDFIHANAMMVN